MEQCVLDKEHVFARLAICPGLFEQLGPIQQYHKVSVGTKCLNLEIIPRDLLIFEEINNKCCFQVRFESMRTPRYLT